MKTRRAEVVKTWSRGGENEESRGSEYEESRGGENKESRGNVRKKAGKKKDGKRKSVQQKEDKRVSGKGLSGGKMVEDNKSREKEKTVHQKKKGDRKHATKER